MNDKKIKRYIIDTMTLLKKLAKKAKKDADIPRVTQASGDGQEAPSIWARLQPAPKQLNLKGWAMQEGPNWVAARRRQNRFLNHERYVPRVTQASGDGQEAPSIWARLQPAPKQLNLKGWAMQEGPNWVAARRRQNRCLSHERYKPKEGFEDYNKGVIMGYYSIITVLKHQAFAFCIDQKELCLADIQPDIDLLGLHRNSDIDFGEDNWAIDIIMTPEKVKSYLSDSIRLLKEQAREAKKDADKLDKGNENYNQGHLMAYRSVFFLLKHQASVLNIDEKELGLADIDPDIDLMDRKTSPT